MINKKRFLYKNAQVKIIFLFITILSISLILVGAGLFDKYDDSYTISEHTEYGFYENTIYINITDNVGKDNYLNISHIFDENYLTDQIDYRDFKILTDVEKNIYGLANTSLGKYKTIETQCNDSNIFNNETQQNETIQICNDVYLDDSNNQMNCDYILVDKSCLIEEEIIIGTQTVKQFIDMPLEKEKIVIEGKNIEQKQKGIPIAKNSTIQLKLTYSHPLAIKENKPTEQQNKYDIEVCSVDGQYCSLLDPTWFNPSWDYNKEITNLTGNITYMVLNRTVNDNDDWNDTRFVSCYNESLIFNHTLEAEFGTYGQFRVNNLGENCTLRYYGNSEATSTSNASKVYFEPVSCYYFDINANDFCGTNDGTVNGATLTSGYINGSYSFDGTSGYINVNSLDDLGATSDKTFQFWVYQDDDPTAGEYLFDTTNRFIIATDYDGSRNAYGFYDGSSWYESGSNTAYYGQWAHVVLVISNSGTRAQFYVNGVTSGSLHTVSANSFGAVKTIGQRFGGSGSAFDGQIDEVLIYDKALTPTQINQLYTQTAPNIVEGEENQDQNPQVVLNYPENNSVENSTYVFFNVTVTDDSQVENVSIYIDGILNQTNTSQFNGTYTFNISIPESNHNWSILAYDNASQSNQSETRYFISDFFNPSVNITFPENNGEYNYNITTINSTASDIHLESCWYSLDNFTTNTTFTCNTNVTGLNSDEGFNYWRVCANDSAGKENCTLSIFEVDTTIPFTNITFPINGTYYNYQLNNMTYNATDLNLDKCWYSTDNGATNSSPVSCSGTFLINSVEGQNNWTMYANDTFSNENSSKVIFYQDTVNPIITINSPDAIEKLNYNETNVTFNLTSNEIIPSCILSLDNFTTNTTMETSDNLTFTKILQPNIRENTVKYYCYDYANNVNVSEKDFYVEKFLNQTGTQTIIIGGNLEYDWVYLGENTKLEVNSTIKYINLTIKYYMNTTEGLNGSQRGYTEGEGIGNATEGTFGACGANNCAGGDGGAGGNNTGGDGGDPFSGAGGIAYINGNLTNINYTIGSGGAGRDRVAGSGGAGIIINVPILNSSGKIESNGGLGQSFSLPSLLSGAGGGSGGLILINTTKIISNNLTIESKGGKGGDSDAGAFSDRCQNGAGGGSGGLILINYGEPIIGNYTTSALGGIGGNGQGNSCPATNGDSGGNGTVVLTLTSQAPEITYNETIPTPDLNTDNIYLTLNISDNENDNIEAVYFNLTSPNGTLIINNKNGTLVNGDTDLGQNETWESPRFNISNITQELGRWNWSILIVSDGINQNTTYTDFFNIADNDSLSLIITSLEDNQIIYRNISIPINYVATDNVAVDTCWYSLDGGTTNVTLTNCSNSTFSTVAGVYNFSMWINDSSNNINYTLIENITIIEDIINPIIEIINPTGTLSSRTFTTKINVTDLGGAKYCTVNVTVGASTEIANTNLTYNSVTTYWEKSLTVSSDSDYVMNAICYDYSGLSNTTNKSFSVDTTPAPTGGGGGGGGTVVISGEAGWTMEVADGISSYTKNIPKGTAKTLTIDFENIGDSSRTLTLSCIDTKRNMCQYVTFEDKTFELPLIKEVKLTKTFTVTLPNEIETGEYQFNIIATDDLDRNGAITVNIATGQGILIETLSTITNKTKRGIPYALIFIPELILLVIIITNLIDEKNKYRTIIAFGSSLLISLITIYLMPKIFPNL